MIRLSPLDYNFVQVERPVTTDAKPFLARAQAIGTRIMGEETVSSITDFGFPEADGSESVEPVHIETPVTASRFEVASSDELSLVLLHRGISQDLASRYGVLAARRNLDKEFITKYETVETPAGKKDRAEIRKPGLLHELAKVSETHHLDHAQTPVHFNRIDIVGEPGRKIILGLFPDPAQVAARALHQQAALAANHLMRHNSRLARPTSPWQVTIPFARFPNTVSDRDYELLMNELQRTLRTAVRLVLGKPRVTSS